MNNHFRLHLLDNQLLFFLVLVKSMHVYQSIQAQFSHILCSHFLLVIVTILPICSSVVETFFISSPQGLESIENPHILFPSYNLFPPFSLEAVDVSPDIDFPINDCTKSYQLHLDCLSMYLCLPYLIKRTIRLVYSLFHCLHIHSDLTNHLLSFIPFVQHSL